MMINSSRSPLKINDNHTLTLNDLSRFSGSNTLNETSKIKAIGSKKKVESPRHLYPKEQIVKPYYKETDLIKLA